MTQGTHRARVFASLLLGSLLFVSGARADTSDSYRSSYLLESRGDVLGALAHMREIRKAAGPSYFTSLRTGWLAFLTHDLGAAETSYREAVSAKPNSIEAKLGLSLVLYAAQKWKPLETVCKQILAADPKNIVARARLAAGHYAAHNYPEAAALYRKLMDEYPGDLDVQTGYAWALQRMGKRDEAQKIFRSVIAVSPDNPNALQGLAAE